MGRKRPNAASKSVEKYLAPNEAVVLELRQHWARVLPAVLCCLTGLVLVLVAGFMATASLGILTNIAWWVWLVLIGHLVWRVIEWWDETFVITNRRLILVHGIFIKKVAMMPLSKVTDMSYNRSIGARILGYGTFVMESAGQEQALSTIDFVRSPDAIYRQLCGLIFGEDSSPSQRDEAHDMWESDEHEERPAYWHDRWQDWHEDWSSDEDTQMTRVDVDADGDIDVDADVDADGDVDRKWHHSTVPMPVRRPIRRRRDDTDPYGLVTGPLSTNELWSENPYSGGIDSSFDDQDEDSAWSVSHEHATRPQPARRPYRESRSVDE